jgi:hypothetical protein
VDRLPPGHVPAPRPAAARIRVRQTPRSPSHPFS